MDAKALAIDYVKAKHARGEKLNGIEQRLWDEEISISFNPAAAQPRRKHVTIAALYLLGGSYAQLMHAYAASKGSVHEAIARHLRPQVRAARPHAANKGMLSWDQFSAYFKAAQRIPGQLDAVRLAAAIRKVSTEIDDSLSPDPNSDEIE